MTAFSNPVKYYCPIYIADNNASFSDLSFFFSKNCSIYSKFYYGISPGDKQLKLFLVKGLAKFYNKLFLNKLAFELGADKALLRLPFSSLMALLLLALLLLILFYA